MNEVFQPIYHNDLLEPGLGRTREGNKFNFETANFSFSDDTNKLVKSEFVELDELKGHKYVEGNKFDIMSVDLDNMLQSKIFHSRPSKNTNLFICQEILENTLKIKSELKEMFGFKTMITDDCAKKKDLAIITLPNNQQLKFSLYYLILLYKSVESLNPRHDGGINSEGTKNFALEYLSALKYGPMFVSYFLFKSILFPKLMQLDDNIRLYCDSALNRAQVEEMVTGAKRSVTGPTSNLRKLPETYGFFYPS
jgi:hypothetical protein